MWKQTILKGVSASILAFAALFLVNPSAPAFASGGDSDNSAIEAVVKEYAEATESALREAMAKLKSDPGYLQYVDDNPDLCKLKRLASASAVTLRMTIDSRNYLEQLPLNDRKEALERFKDVCNELRDKYVEDDSLDAAAPADGDEGDKASDAKSKAPAARTAIGAKMQNLKVSENKRFLVTEDGEPFFWLGDTAWELFHRSSREDARFYLTTRKLQGYNVIQAVAIAEFGGIDSPNYYGHLPFVNPDDPTPAVVDGPDNDYWDHVDFVVNEANKMGMYIGFLPTWGAWWKDRPTLKPENAGAYGEWLGKRYKDKKLVWILGGDRTIDNDRERQTIEELAKGLRRGDEGAHLITFHPRGGSGSSEYFHNAEWLDFNMRQNGHNCEYNSYKGVREDYDRDPVKPVIDGEPIYEDHPVSFNPDNLGHSIAADVRRAFYWDVFTGACGHTYGHHSIWQFYDEGRSPVNRPLYTWRDALKRPGGNQMHFGKELIESRPFLTRIPDPELIVPDEYESSVPGAGTRYFAATRDEDGTYAFVYIPVGRSVTVNTGRLNASKIHAYFFNPRDGASFDLGVFDNEGTKTFDTPLEGEALDWVLVLDDEKKHYPAPGDLIKIEVIVTPTRLSPLYPFGYRPARSALPIPSPFAPHETVIIRRAD